ncbi:MAG: hypothetical protein DMG15_10980 [Acidobacteria bacterium]|nr:MAG: hypothetical protein DMG16_18940 [Acidobacteriota bacterium]PYS13505.1 MAG: hypothetical protein DMG15_10980 [Acidobacteriota bacterium]
MFTLCRKRKLARNHNGRVRVSERPATCVFRRCRLCVTVDCMNETLTIRLGEKLAYALSQEARRTGLAKGEIARQALEARLQSTGKLSAMERHFGCMSGPADLSTNKAYRRVWKKRRV